MTTVPIRCYACRAAPAEPVAPWKRGWIAVPPAAASRRWLCPECAVRVYGDVGVVAVANRMPENKVQ